MDVLKWMAQSFEPSADEAKRHAARKILHYRRPLKSTIYTRGTCVVLIIVSLALIVTWGYAGEADGMEMEGYYCGMFLAIAMNGLIYLTFESSRRVALRPEYDWAENYREEDQEGDP